MSTRQEYTYNEDQFPEAVEAHARFLASPTPENRAALVAFCGEQQVGEIEEEAFVDADPEVKRLNEIARKGALSTPFVPMGQELEDAFAAAWKAARERYHAQKQASA